MTNGQINRSRNELSGHASQYATIVPVYTILLHCITFQIEYVPRDLVDVRAKYGQLMTNNEIGFLLKEGQSKGKVLLYADKMEQNLQDLSQLPNIS